MIKIAIDVIRADLLANGKPKLGLAIDNVEQTIVSLDTNEISEVVKVFFFLFYLLNFFL